LTQGQFIKLKIVSFEEREKENEKRRKK